MNAKRVFKLDLLSVRPYLTIKNLVILLGLSIIYVSLSKNPLVAFLIPQMFALLFSAYPFMVGEESGIDPLYKIFSIEAKDVVKGRYLIAILFTGLMLLAGIILSLTVSYLYPLEGLLQILLLIAPITFIGATFIIFIEYPIYFKYGYSKGKTLASIPFLLFGIVFFLSTYFEGSVGITLQTLITNKKIGIGLIFIVWIVTMMISYKLSNKYYSERDF